MINNILVAVDGSENSTRSLDFALDLAEKYGAALTILNVSDSPVIGAYPLEPAAVSGETMVAFAKDLRKFHEEILAKAVARATKSNPHILVSWKLREGNPALEIVDAAKEGSFDIIVVGHRGLGRVKELFLGNIAEKVAHRASCTVVIVK